METTCNHYSIKAGFAKREGVPASFMASVLQETPRALYVYGHGTMDPNGLCVRCGRTLTHPGSILLGIGPDCLNDWSARDIKMDNMSEEDKIYLQSLIKDQRIDGWIPKGVIKIKTPTSDIIPIPEDHKMLQMKTKKTSSKRATVEGDRFKIQFPFNYEVLEQVKSIPGRKYHPEGKFWTSPINANIIISLRKFGFEIIGLTKDNFDDFDSLFFDKSKIKPIEVPGFKKELYPFQKEGVSFINAKRGRVLLADEMGLGKTIQALAYLQLHPEKKPVIVVCPASVKFNWRREIQQCMSKGKVEILSGKKPHKITGEIIIINYDILSDWMPTLKKLNPQVVITDECHYYKSNNTMRTKAVKMLAKGVPHFLALSGTPIVNRPMEIYNALNIIDSSIMPNFWHFAQRYCGAHHNGYGWDFGGATNTQELHEKLSDSIMIRRKKKDVLKDLPDKVRAVVPIDLDNWKEYIQAETNFISFVRQTKGAAAAAKASNAEQLSQIEALKQIAVQGKLEGAIEWIKDFLNSGEKLIVFAVHKFVIDRLMKEFGDIAVKIDGSVPTKKRDQNVLKFQTNPKISLFVGNIQAAGVGITLTAASNVVTLELPWTPGELAQAEDRAHRIGQKNSVTIWNLLALDTIEDRMANILDHKLQVLGRVLDGEVIKQESLLSELIGQYK